MLEDAKKKLTDEIEELNHELTVTLPATLEKALELGDLRENGDYHAAIERQQFIGARLNQLRMRLGQLAQIDLSEIPGDRVGFGSTVVVQDMATKEKETYELVVPDAMDLDRGDVSIASPLGRGLLNGKVGDKVVINLPMGVRKLKIVELTTFHDSMEG